MKAQSAKWEHGLRGKEETNRRQISEPVQGGIRVVKKTCQRGYEGNLFSPGEVGKEVRKENLHR